MLRTPMLLAGALLFGAATAHAIPVLQTYVDGAIYDAQTQSWITSQTDFDLWIVADVGVNGPLQGVRLVVSYFGLGGTSHFAAMTTSKVTDPSTAATLMLSQTGTGGHPVLPAHGIFNDATLHHWEDLYLGDLSLTDSPIGDFNGMQPFPTSFPDQGEICVYRVHVEGWTKVHFDAYGTTVADNGRETTWKTPGSHDGQVPVAPSTWSGVKSLFGR